MRLIASENEHLHLPMLLGASPSLSNAILSTVAYPALPPPTPVAPLAGGKRSRYRFWNCDSFDAAERLVGTWGAGNVAVLNMANAFQAGGGYLNGATAQEEALCRRSTLYAHIAFPQFYPIHAEGGLWSRDVCVFRSNDDDGGDVRDSDDFFSVGVVSVAAIDCPKLSPSGDNYADAREERSTINKIKAILRISKLHSQKALVLGAFGCGAFRNPPARMATLFLDALTRDPEFTNTFDEVVFAVLERNGSDNMRPWREVWTGVAEDEPGTGSAESQEVIVVDDSEDSDVVVVEALDPRPSTPELKPAEPTAKNDCKDADEPVKEGLEGAASGMGADAAAEPTAQNDVGLKSPYFAGKKS